MDDRELEARLGTYLHQHFDNPPVPAGLAAAVRQGMESAPAAKVGFSVGRRGLQLGWAATAAIALVIGAVLLSGRGLGPAAPGPSTTPVPTLRVVAERWFVVLPPSSAAPSTADRDAAMQVLMDRLTGLGLKSTSSAQRGWMMFTLERDGLPDEAIRRILSATGDVEFVPLPAEDYGDGKLTAEVGKELPKDEPALFGWDGIEAVAESTDQQGRRTLNFTLKPAARQSFGDYTTGHLLEYIAIVIDGRVAVMPVINEPITGGEIAISSGGAPGSAEEAQFDEGVAVLIGGMLPDSWQGADVRQILTQQAAIEAVRASGHGGSGDIEGADFDALLDGARWTPVWRVSFADGTVVTLDAVTGEWLSTGIS